MHKDPEGYISASDSASSFDDDNDFGDWRSDDDNSATTLALFPDASGQRASFKSPVEALHHAKTQHGCDLVAIVSRLELDTLQAIRLINHIRRNNLTPEQVNAVTQESAVLSDDEELKPVAGFEDDGLLQVDFDLLAIDAPTGDAGSSDKARIQELESQLATARSAFDELRTIHASSLGLSSRDFTESSGSQLSLDQRTSIASSSLARTKRGANDAETTSSTSTRTPPTLSTRP